MPSVLRNLKLEIEYDGTNYCGWQIQNSRQSIVRSPQKKTIQETIEKSLQKILQEKIKLIASGRTDAGVHALAQVANFTTNSKIPPDKLQHALNSILPDDIVINKLKEAGTDFHSRFSARSKIYRYLVLSRSYPCVFLKNRVHFCPYPLNVELMRQEAGLLMGEHDFKAFCASGGASKSTIRTIKDISVSMSNYALYAARYPLVVIDIEANGFLYNMVRGIVGTLLDIGRGRLEKGHIKKMLRLRNRKLCGVTAPAKGLYLVKVKYY